MRACERLAPYEVQTLKVCSVCGKCHWLTEGRMTLGKIDSYTAKWRETKKHMRNKHHNDLIQPYKNGKPNDEYLKVYGTPPHETKKTATTRG